MQLEGYSNLTKFATGGMAAVYKARQLSLNRTVAIKFLSAEHLWDEEAKALFDQESLVIAQLNHPNIIHIIDRGLNEKGRPYFVMDYIQGSDLSQVMHQEKLTLNSKINLLIQICKGMATAHKNGVIHRDIKPSNFVVDTENHLHILDFGIAWIAASGKPENIVGTPDYMSPEQFTNPESVTQLSDIYSLGVIMYEMFFGTLPPGSPDKLTTSLSNLPDTLAQLIAQCLETNPQKRPATADEIRLRLLKVTKGAHLNQNQKSEADKAINNTDNKFSLLDIIKKNEFGAVYLFEDLSRHNLLVIKKRTKSVAGYNEAKALSTHSHENIIKIYGTSKSKQTFIIVMEHLSNGSLQDRLVRKFSLNKFIPVAESICKALQFSHNENITHGNLRPSNILYSNKNHIKISDFGLDEHYATTGSSNDWYQPNDRGGSSKTRDMYSAGAIFYRMLTGKPVKFSNKRIQNTEEFDGLNKAIKNILRNLMEEDTSNHYQSFDQVLPDLNKLRQYVRTDIVTKPDWFKKILRILGILLLFNSVILAIYLYFNPQLLDDLRTFIGL
ncbi:MAG: serine/threonine protein kinase [endosymbiont of Galathealinum brachiosum]|uniref:Serine/threonine protein kinase n=1 Tax=endosymbiont of Galathealinum brachiosum TaxID=2200906 RepID=A0A370DJW7_9GAMM|nr:MAG: serine/threonine protein kinase [endosymbiont of Galathealinum brachiosum]